MLKRALKAKNNQEIRALVEGAQHMLDFSASHELLPEEIDFRIPDPVWEPALAWDGAVTAGQTSPVVTLVQTYLTLLQPRYPNGVPFLKDLGVTVP